MANPRQDDRSSHRAGDTIQHMSEKTAEEANRVGRAAADTGMKMAQAGADASEKVARASADLFQQNAETVQNALRVSLDMATALVSRSTDQLGRTYGLSGEEAQKATERAARNAEAIIHSTTAANKVMSEATREYFEFTRRQMEKSMERVSQLQSCRNPQEFVAAHSDFIREMMTGAFESSRRMAENSMKLAEDATKRVSETMERHAA